MSDNIEVKVAEHGQRIKGLEKRVENIESDNKSLNRLTTLLEEQIRISNKKDDQHQEQIEKQNQVLSNINTNLTNLNTRFDSVENRVGFLENSQKSNLIDLNKLWRDIIFKVVPTLVGAYLIYKFGIK